MNLSQAYQGARVAYTGAVPPGQPFTGNLQWGTISSRSDKCIFVRFDDQVAKLGWDGATSQACRPEDLWLYEEPPAQAMARTTATRGILVFEEED